MRTINEGVRFLLEITSLAAVAIWGWHIGASTAVRLLAAAGAPLAIAFVWGAFVAPRSTRRLADPQRLGVEIAVFVAATVGLWIAVGPAIGVGFAAIVALNLVLMTAWSQR